MSDLKIVKVVNECKGDRGSGLSGKSKTEVLSYVKYCKRDRGSELGRHEKNLKKRVEEVCGTYKNNPNYNDDLKYLNLAGSMATK
jgi:hypothetical protein